MRKKTRRINKNAAKPMSGAALRRFVMREAAKLSGELESVEKVKAEEVDADEYADTLEHDIDMYKAMQIKEEKMRRLHRKLIKEARRVRKNKMLARKKILRKLK